MALFRCLKENTETMKRHPLINAFLAAAAIFALVPMASVKADGAKNSPSLVAFKQIAPKIVELVYAVDLQEKIPANYAAFVHVVNTADKDEKNTFQTGIGIDGKPETWVPGKKLTSKLVTAYIPATAPDGTYEIRVGFYDTVNGPRLEMTGNDDGARRYTVGKLVIAGKTITSPGTPDVTPAMEGRMNIIPSMTDTAQAGPRQFTYRLSFMVGEKIPAGYRIFDHIVYSPITKDHDIAFQAAPGIAAAPETWVVGQKTVGDLITVDLPSDLPDGEYTIGVGLYHSVTGLRLHITGADDGGNRYTVAHFTVSNGGAKIVFAKQ